MSEVEGQSDDRLDRCQKSEGDRGSGIIFACDIQMAVPIAGVAIRLKKKFKI